MFGRNKRYDGELVSRLDRALQEIGELRSHVVRLRDDHDNLEDRHTRLRGKVYGARLHKAAEEEAAAPAPQLTRQQLKASLVSSGRFIPGRPAVHSE